MVLKKARGVETLKKKCTIIFCLVSIILSNIYMKPIKSSAEEFGFVSVSLSVLDINETPVEDAKVLAFSEDWGIRSPGTREQRTFCSTDSTGTVTMMIPIGNWSFFAVSGWSYAYSHPGRGIFLSRINLTISIDTSIALKPSATITIRPKDVLGNSIDVEARIMETHHTPIVPTDIAAVSNNGKLIVEVSDEYNYDMLLVRKPSSVSEGYYMTLRAIRAGFSEEVIFTRSKLSEIKFEALDINRELTEGNVEVRLPDFDLNNMVIDFTLQGNAVVYFTPCVAQFNYRFMGSGWYLYLGGNNFFNLTAGSSQTICFGGPFKKELQVIPWASTGMGGSPRFTPMTQIWLKITDSFEHVLFFMGTPSGKPQFPFTLTQNGSTIFASSIPQGDPFTISIETEYQRDSSPEFMLSGDLGPFGPFKLNGKLISEATMYRVLNISTRYFLATVPEGFPITTSRNLAFMDKLYETYMYMVGATIDGKIQYEVDITGGGFWWERLPVPAKLLLIMYITSDPLSPYTLFFNAHEFGHTRTLRNPTIIAPEYFIESLPTLLTIEGLSRLYGPNMWLWGTGSHDLFFYHLRGTPLTNRYDFIETSQFVLAYIQKKFGWNVHKHVINGWSGNQSKLVRKLTEAGFNQIEALATLYSYVVGDNLGWLFDLAGLGVTGTRIDEGLELIKKVESKPPSLELSNPEVSGLRVRINGVTLPGTPDVMVTKIHWNWGDGNSEDAWFPSEHTYSESSTYMVTVTSYQDDGLSTTKTVEVTVTSKEPTTITLSVSPSEGSIDVITRAITTITVSGRIEPGFSTTIEISIFSGGGGIVSPIRVVTTVTTSSNGEFSSPFVPTSLGVYTITASFLGNDRYQASSAQASINVISDYISLIVTAIIIIIAATVGSIEYLRRKSKPIQEIPPPPHP